MQRLLAFIYRYRVFGFFLLLEAICFWLFTSYNRYYNAYFFNSSNQIAGTIQSFSTNASDYFELIEINKDLIAENARLREALINAMPGHNPDPDTLVSKQFEIIPAKVVNNDFKKSRNHLTLNRGLKDGVKPDMGVVGPDGVVGKIKSVSKHFSTVTSLLHQGLMISSELKKNSTLCTVQWEAFDHTEADLRFIPRHIPLSVGDTIVTSGFNSVFPEGLMVGIVSVADLEDESPFYNAKIKLATQFPSLEYVYIVKNVLKAEKDSLELIYE